MEISFLTYLAQKYTSSRSLQNVQRIAPAPLCDFRAISVACYDAGQHPFPRYDEFARSTPDVEGRTK